MKHFRKPVSRRRIKRNCQRYVQFMLMTTTLSEAAFLAAKALDDLRSETHRMMRITTAAFRGDRRAT